MGSFEEARQFVSSNQCNTGCSPPLNDHDVAVCCDSVAQFGQMLSCVRVRCLNRHVSVSF